MQPEALLQFHEVAVRKFDASQERDALGSGYPGSLSSAPLPRTYPECGSNKMGDWEAGSAASAQKSAKLFRRLDPQKYRPHHAYRRCSLILGVAAEYLSRLYALTADVDHDLKGIALFLQPGFGQGHAFVWTEGEAFAGSAVDKDAPDAIGFQFLRVGGDDVQVDLAIGKERRKGGGVEAFGKGRGHGGQR